QRVEGDRAHAEHVRTPASAWFASAIVVGVSFPTSTYALRMRPPDRIAICPDGCGDPSRRPKSERGIRRRPASRRGFADGPSLSTATVTPFVGQWKRSVKP